MFRFYEANKKEFFQWDLNQKLIVDLDCIDEVHFCNQTSDRALVVEVYEYNGVRVADVPNILLQTVLPIRAYGYCNGRYTLDETIFNVRIRIKPDNYVYTETDVRTWDDLHNEIKVLQRDVKQLQIANEGNTYEFSTDSKAAYTKSIPTNALPYASIDTLGGMSYKYNQLAKELTSDNWYGAATFNGNVMTFSPTAQYSTAVQTTTLVNGHKYLISLNAKSSNYTGNVAYFIGNTAYVGGEGVSIEFNDITSSYKNFTTIGVYNQLNTPQYIGFIQLENVSDCIIDIKDLFVVDLTAMYGTGKEPTTVEQFLADYPMYNGYVPYTEGDITNSNVTSVDSIGVNIWDEEWEVGNINISTGELINGSDTIRSKNFIRIIPNKRYYKLANSTSTDGKNLVFTFYDENYNVVPYIQVNASEDASVYGNSADSTKSRPYFTTPNRAIYMKFRAVNVYGTTYNHDICINVSNDAINGTYFPYNHNNYPIPSSIQELEGYGWGVNDSCYNYIDFENKKFVKRVGRVDLGTLNWQEQSGGFSSNGVANNIKYSGNISIVSNILCSKYENKTLKELTNGNLGISILSNCDIWIKDSSYTDAATFKAAMNGIILYYELATPVITDLSNILTDDDSYIEVEGGGTLTFENTYKNATPSDITYQLKL